MTPPWATRRPIPYRSAAGPGADLGATMTTLAALIAALAAACNGGWM